MPSLNHGNDPGYLDGILLTANEHSFILSVITLTRYHKFVSTSGFVVVVNFTDTNSIIEKAIDKHCKVFFWGGGVGKFDSIHLYPLISIHCSLIARFAFNLQRKLSMTDQFICVRETITLLNTKRSLRKQMIS